MPLWIGNSAIQNGNAKQAGLPLMSYLKGSVIGFSMHSQLLSLTLYSGRAA
jgi:hypothetical protein